MVRIKKIRGFLVEKKISYLKICFQSFLSNSKSATQSAGFVTPVANKFEDVIKLLR